MRFIVLVVVAAILLLSGRFLIKRPTVGGSDFLEEDLTDTPIRKKARRSSRTPASVASAKKSQIAEPGFVATNKNDTLFKAFEGAENNSAGSGNDTEQKFAGSFGSTNSTIPDSPRVAQRINGDASTSGERSPSGSISPSSAGASFTGQPIVTSPPIEDSTSDTIADSDSGSSGGSNAPSPSMDLFNCSASVGSGSYNNPVSVSLTCSTAADIEICIDENSCCDPEGATPYSGPVTIGTEMKTYCMSYIGTDPDGNKSVVSEHFYTFNPNLPNVQLSNPKIAYQTTQLAGKASFTSTDFGVQNVNAGMLNLRGTDPGASNCEDMVTGVVNPSSYVLMPATSVSGYTTSQQVDVSLPKSFLDYGDNYLVTYLSHSVYTSAYGCSVKKTTLEDFPYFEETPSNAVLNGTVLEFSGGFTSVGFFEEPTQVYRGPAGSSTEEVSGQELRTGLIGVFH